MGKTLRNLLFGGLAVIVGTLSAKHGLDHHKQKKLQEQMFLDTVAEYVQYSGKVAKGEKKYYSNMVGAGKRLSDLDWEVWEDSNFFRDDSDDLTEAFEKRGHVFCIMDSVNMPKTREYVFGKIANNKSGEYSGKGYKLIMFESLAKSLDTLLYEDGDGDVREAFSNGDRIYINLNSIQLSAEKFYDIGKKLKKSQILSVREAVALRTYDEIIDSVKFNKGDIKRSFIEEYMGQRVKICIAHELEHLLSDDEERAYLNQLSIQPTYYDFQSILQMFPSIKKEFEKIVFSDKDMPFIDKDNEIFFIEKETIKKTAKIIYSERYGVQ